MNNVKLINLYTSTSKHSHYQILASPLRELVPNHMLEICSRYEQERLDYILKHLKCTDITFADIGGNTGFFTLELLSRGAKSALFIEGNNAHSDFVNEAAIVLGWQDRVMVHPYYMTFEDDLSLIDVDVALLLNVLHHVGDDYGNQTQSIDTAKKNIIDSLLHLSKGTKFLVFQLGFNWKGNRELPLFEQGTKSEIIDFIKSETSNNWTIEHIGIAEKSSGRIIYNDVNSKNIRRQDSLGEFLNRPLFIMRSKLYGKNTT